MIFFINFIISEFIDISMNILKIFLNVKLVRSSVDPNFLIHPIKEKRFVLPFFGVTFDVFLLVCT